MISTSHNLRRTLPRYSWGLSCGTIATIFICWFLSLGNSPSTLSPINPLTNFGSTFVACPRGGPTALKTANAKVCFVSAFSWRVVAAISTAVPLNLRDCGRFVTKLFLNDRRWAVSTAAGQLRRAIPTQLHGGHLALRAIHLTSRWRPPAST